jgi:hypothetical protein
MKRITCVGLLALSPIAPVLAAGPKPADLQPVKIPQDGKVERVKVDGVTVPLIKIMENGAVVLVDTDGRKPRTWEEQYKRKGHLPKGYFDVHKSDTNHNNAFKDDEIDREGLWKMDEQGNITRQ